MSKYNISFTHNTDLDTPCLAKACDSDGVLVTVALGTTWALAEERLITKLEGFKSAGEPPEPKEVEI